MRRSRRSTASLDWELDLLEHLGASGFLVPEALPTRSGERHADGFVVSPFIEGREPTDDPDWACVVAVLEQLHRVTVGWPRRPGARSTTDLLTIDTSDDVDLALLPAEDRDACRAAWHRLEGWPTSVVHGDPGAPNVRMTRDGVALLDWEPSRRRGDQASTADISGDEGAREQSDSTAG